MTKFQTCWIQADTKINVTQKLKFCFDSVENISGKEENAEYQYFLLFPKYFWKASSSRVVTGQDCVVKS